MQRGAPHYITVLYILSRGFKIPNPSPSHGEAFFIASKCILLQLNAVKRFAVTKAATMVRQTPAVNFLSSALTSSSFSNFFCHC